MVSVPLALISSGTTTFAAGLAAMVGASVFSDPPHAANRTEAAKSGVRSSLGFMGQQTSSRAAPLLRGCPVSARRTTARPQCGPHHPENSLPDIARDPRETDPDIAGHP